MSSDDYDDEKDDGLGCAWLLEIAFVVVIVVMIVVVALCGGC